MTERIIGIDLGTTNSVVAVLERGEPRVIPTAEGGRLCPSVVAFAPSGDRYVGDIAKRQLLTHPARTIASIKRHIGTTHTVTVDDRSYTPPEISAMILQKLRDDAERYLGEPVNKAVITVPAYFSDAQRQATKDAGRIAGLEVIRIVNEPTAAALAYGLDRQQAHTVLVWDLGGGTFDVSILSLGDGIFQVLATNGDTHLGGDDWDEALARYLLNVFRERTGIDLSTDRMGWQRLKDAAETAKMQLSAHELTHINLPFLAAVDGQPKHLELPLTRREFEALTGSLRERMIAPTLQALSDAGMTTDSIDAVLLVGGSTRMPAVQKLANDTLRHEPVVGVNPDEVVALGAAVQGGIISGELANLVLLDVTPLSLGLETANGGFVRIIPRNTTIPTSETKAFTTSRDNQQAVEIHVLQGERELAVQNKSLGRFSLRGIRPAPRGLPRIDVTFDIDENGIVHVSARDQATGVSQQVVVTASSGLSEADVQAMINEAELFAKIDQEILEETTQRRQGEQLLASVNARLDQLGNAVPIQELVRLDRGLVRMRQALESGEAAELRAAIDALRDLSLSLVAIGTTPTADDPAFPALS
ncbi:MAG TPA: molecular chaperone DnaK [Armatimonadota bacterium]|jgi:molecular chaperone DnaK